MMRCGRRVRAGVVVLGALAATGCGGREEAARHEELERLRVVGLAYLEEERLAEAAERFERLARMAPGEPLGPANLAVAEMRRGAPEAARRAASQAVERSPADPDVRLIAAVTSADAGDPAAAETHLRTALAQDSAHPGVLWALYGMTDDPDALARLVRHRPGNLPARLAAAELRAQAGDLETVVAHLEYVGQLLPPGDSEARTALADALASASRGEAEGTLRRVRIAHNLLRADHLYAQGLSELTGRPGSRAEPLRRFRRVVGPVPSAHWDPLAVTFVSVTSLDAGWSGGVPTDVDGDGDEDLVVAEEGMLRCLMNDRGGLTGRDCAASNDVRGAPVQAADFDGDGRPDLLMAGPDGVGILYGGAEDFAARGELPGREVPAWTAIAADLDHDGDLDILAGGPGPTRLYRQTGPGRFVEVGAESGVAGLRGVRAATFGDLDLDGDLDVVLANREGVHRLDNVRHGKFEPANGPRLPFGTPSIADVNGDGWFDVVAAASDGIHVAAADGTGGLGPFARVASVPTDAGSEIGHAPWPAILVEDFDLDGSLDVLFVSEAAGMLAFRGSGDGGFVASPGILRSAVASGPPETGHVLAFDLDGDGDFDLATGRPSAPELFRNDGGERNHVLEVGLLALADGSGKVNRLGIGSRIDVWAGEGRQSRVVRGELERFGLGDHDRADVVRIEWTNGVPQNVFAPTASERLVERQVLKGSCAFLYAWTGDGFGFVTDMMWKSALGMPLGIMAGEVAYASPDPSVEYVRIPPGMLAQRDGGYEIRITEELWEVAYLDRLELLAVDHPESVELYVDEAFGVPAVPNDRLFAVRARRPPELALDHRGTDVGSELAERDFRFVGGFDAGPVQGITRLHDLTLTLAGAAGRPARLFLGGWIHPTDASINVRLGQAGGPSVVRPYLEVPDAAGGWRRLEAAIDFPSGKNKTVVVELPDGLPADDPRLRIRTNMEVYWDVAFYSTSPSTSPLVRRRLEPAAAELAVRGFSSVFRRGGRYGPHWYEYERVREASPWRPLPGAYTRTGDVRDLLLNSDDRYVVFGPGDEIAVRFEAPVPPPPGWERTFFLYSHGFLKDADLNTLGGDRVGPLPRHGLEGYPPSTAPPASQRDFAAEYLGRRVDGARPPARPLPPRP